MRIHSPNWNNASWIITREEWFYSLSPVLFCFWELKNWPLRTKSTTSGHNNKPEKPFLANLAQLAAQMPETCFISIQCPNSLHLCDLTRGSKWTSHSLFKGSDRLPITYAWHIKNIKPRFCWSLHITDFGLCWLMIDLPGWHYSIIPRNWMIIIDRW